jgi:hypothetical protein
MKRRRMDSRDVREQAETDDPHRGKVSAPGRTRTCNPRFRSPISRLTAFLQTRPKSRTFLSILAKSGHLM